MTLLDLYGLVNNEKDNCYDLYVAIGIQCTDGEVYMEHTNTKHWTYNFLNQYGGYPIFSFTSSPKYEKYATALTVWIYAPDNCEYVASNYKPTPYNAPTIHLDNDETLSQ